MADCACTENWVVYSCDLSTGQVRAVLQPISMDWENRLNQPGQGTLRLATKDVRIRDIWPHLTSIFIARINGDGASPENPVAEWAGMIDSVDADDSGSTTVGMVGIEGYLDHRNIKEPLSFPPFAPGETQRAMSQTVIGASLVNYARPNGIPLVGVAGTSIRERQRNYQSWNRKYVGEAISDLTQVIEGPDWESVHTFSSGNWTTEMIFRDFVGVAREIVLASDREAQGYRLQIDAKDHATWVDAIGSGEEADMVIETAVDPAGIYPQFDATPAWKDVVRRNTLSSHAFGYLEDYKEPFATPQVTIKGLEPSPMLLRLGDIISVDVNFGAVTYKGRARILSVSWGVGVDEAESRTFEMIPVTRASESVLNQVPTDVCEDC